MAEGENQNKNLDFNQPDDFGISPNLGKGDFDYDITNSNKDTRAINNPPDVSEDEQQEIASQNQAAIQRMNKLRNAAKTYEGETKTLNIESKIFGGLGGALIKKIPGMRILLSSYKIAPTKQKIEILEKMRRLLRMAKLGASLTDATTQCWTMFGFLVPPTLGLILIIAIPIWVFMLFLYGIMQESGPSKYAKLIAKSVKILNSAISQLKNQLRKEEEQKILKLRYKQLEASYKAGQII